MDCKFIKKEDIKPIKWSGGVTYELCIFPFNSSYSERNFKWRISSAVIEAENSDFTYLPSINRIIMLLDGDMELKHEGHGTFKLDKFEQNSFYGGWKTTSKGKATDFNLMMAEGVSGEISLINNEETKKHIFPFDSYNVAMSAFYSLNDGVSVIIDDDIEFNLNNSDFLYVLSKDINEKKTSFKIDVKKSPEEFSIIAIDVYV